MRVFALLMLLPSLVLAHGDHFTQEETAWMQRQYAIDGFTHCCDPTDVHVGQNVTWRMQGGRYEVLIGTEWHQVPPSNLMRYMPNDPLPENFQGQAILFYSVYSYGVRIWCFFPEPLF